MIVLLFRSARPAALPSAAADPPSPPAHAAAAAAPFQIPLHRILAPMVPLLSPHRARAPTFRRLHLVPRVLDNPAIGRPGRPGRGEDLLLRPVRRVRSVDVPVELPSHVHRVHANQVVGRRLQQVRRPVAFALPTIFCCRNWYLVTPTFKMPSKVNTSGEVLRNILICTMQY